MQSCFVIAWVFFLSVAQFVLQVPASKSKRSRLQASIVGLSSLISCLGLED